MPVPVPPPLVAPALPPPLSVEPLPFGVPISATNPMLPVAAIPYPSRPSYPVPPYAYLRPPGVFAGRPVASQDPEKGINIYPVANAYANMLEHRKNKIMRKRLQSIIDDYDEYPWKKTSKNHRKQIIKKKFYTKW